MKLFIHSLEKTLYEGEANVVTLPAEGGEVSILDHHIPLVTALSKGTIRVKENSSEVKIFPVSSGFAEVQANHLIVLTQ